MSNENQTTCSRMEIKKKRRNKILICDNLKPPPTCSGRPRYKLPEKTALTPFKNVMLLVQYFDKTKPKNCCLNARASPGGSSKMFSVTGGSFSFFGFRFLQNTKLSEVDRVLFRLVRNPKPGFEPRIGVSIISSAMSSVGTGFLV